MKILISCCATILLFGLTNENLDGQQTMRLRANATPIWNDSTLQRELELTREQRREMFELKMEYEEKYYPLSRKRSEVAQNMRLAKSDLQKKESQAEYKRLESELVTLRSQFDEKAKDILLDHQLSSIVDIRLKRLIQNGFLRFIPNLNKELELSEKQKEEINEHLKRFNDRISKIVVEELEKTKNEVVKSLPKPAKDRLSKVLDGYEYRLPQRFDFVYMEQYFFRRVKK